MHHVRAYLPKNHPRDWFPQFAVRFCTEMLPKVAQVSMAVPAATDRSTGGPIYESGGARFGVPAYAMLLESVDSGRLTILTTIWELRRLFGEFAIPADRVDLVLCGHYNPLRLRSHFRLGGALSQWPSLEASPLRPWLFRPLEWQAVERARERPAPLQRAGTGFRGLFSPARLWLRELMTLADPEDGISVLVRQSGEPGNLPMDAYLDELRSYTLALSPAGVGDLCNRDIECFGLGVPVLRPVMQDLVAEPIVANVHYIAVPFETRGEQRDAQWPDFPLDPRRLALDLLETYRRVRHDDVLLRRIAEAAQDYYAENCAWPRNGQRTLDMLYPGA